MSNEQELDRARGVMYGLAYGDALAAPTEFLQVDEILARWPPDGPSQLTDKPSLVTDDTQMALAVGAALVATKQLGEYKVEYFEPQLRRQFIIWLNSPENNRAPGMTCLNACEKLEKNLSWIDATVANSKGCGANMRVAPIALLPSGQNGLTRQTRSALAQFQAAITHGHATALAASDLTTFAIAELTQDYPLNKLVGHLREYARSQREIYHQDWLAELWQRPGIATEIEFISRGWDECLLILDRIETAMQRPDRNSDPCLATGAGWIAEEALATGLYCLLLYPDDPCRALQRAAVTSGDSDSIACLTGALAGACYGMSVWPDRWVALIEYSDQLARIAQQLVE